MAEDDPTLEALEELVRAGRQNMANWLGLMERVDRVRELRQQGISYRDMNIEQGMSVIEAISDNQDRLTIAAARFRRAMAHELHAEGLTPAAIARLFGVSRQRIASLLASSDHGLAHDADALVSELDASQ